MNTGVFDFSGGDAASGWESVGDAVMGGRSEGRALWERNALVFLGSVSLENGGGFASIRSGLLPRISTPFAGFDLRVRGDGKVYKFTLRTDPSLDGISYQAVFKTEAGRTQTVRISLSSFAPTYHGRHVEAAPPAPEDVRRFGFVIADRQEGPFRLEIFSIDTCRD